MKHPKASPPRFPNFGFLRLVHALSILLISTPALAQSNQAPVVIELFTSQSCSECLPAHELLKSASGQGEIPLIPLQMHVNMWDEDWTDPYGSTFLSNRQRQYASSLSADIEAPFFAVDGAHAMSGADTGSLRALIGEAAKEAKARVSLSIENNQLEILVEDTPEKFRNEPLTVWLIASQNGLVDVPNGGDNRGKRLAHGPVVRDMAQVGLVTRGEFKRKLPVDTLGRDKVTWVVLLQSMRKGQIVGAAKVDHPETASGRNTSFAPAKATTERKGPLSESEAYALAESFVAQNGYTEKPHAGLKKIAREAGEFESDLERLVLRRQNTLRSRAVALSKERKDKSPGFTIFFAQTHATQNARVVTMKPDGSDIRVEAGEMPLKMAQKIRGK